VTATKSEAENVASVVTFTAFYQDIPALSISRLSPFPSAAVSPSEFPGAGRHPCVRLNICQAMLENGRENFIRSTCVHTSLKS
jgi:hypothetical protein